MLQDREYQGDHLEGGGLTEGFLSYVWPSMWGPTYTNSYAICISCAGFSIILLAIMKVHLESLNKKMDKEMVQSGSKEKGFRYLS